jgi:hypothetical protein
MTLLKTVLLGSAAGLLALGAAQAADLPVKAAAAVQYVEVCPVYGSGFYKLPGTDICIRHFGSMKFNFAFQDERSAFDEGGGVIVEEGAANTVGWQWTIRPGWDFRSPTEYGTLRAVVQIRVDQRNGVHQDNEPVLTGAMRTNNLIYRGYIEWAGFLIGRASSQFVYWDQDDVVTAVGGDPVTTLTQFTYVFSAPGGLKATIGLEDSMAWQSTAGSLVDLTTLISGGVNPDGPQRLYDIVATISTEQVWGTAKLSGIIHFTHSHANTNGGPGGASDAHEIGTGWGILGGVTFNLPMLGPKDQLLLQAIYCDGVVAACGINGGAENNMTSFERSGQYLSGLQRDIPDTYAVNSGGSTTSWDFENVKAWSVAGQLRHYWAPLWRSNFMASYHRANIPAAAIAAGELGDSSVWDVGANLIWGQSRKTAEIGAEIAYKQTNIDVPAGFNPNIDSSPSGWVFSAFIRRNW